MKHSTLMFFFLYLLVQITFLTCYADLDCEDVRLDNKNGPFSKIPVYNQNLHSNETNLCGDVSAAELVDAYRFYNEDKSLLRLTSPVALAVNYKTSPAGLDFSEKDLTLGGAENVALVLDSSNGTSVCDQKWFEQYFSLGLKKLANYGTLDLNISNMLDGIKKLQIVVNDKSSNFVFDKHFKFTCKPYVFSNLQDLITAVRSAEAYSNPLKRAQSFIHNLCKDHEHPLNFPKPQFFETTDKKKQDLFINFLKFVGDPKQDYEAKKRYFEEYQKDSENIERLESINKLKLIRSQLFKKKPSPVAISFNPAIFLDAEKKLIGKHAAVVIGQRKTSTGCELLIRDSYGPTCTNDSGKPRYKMPCENGNIWVPAIRLMGVVKNLTWIPSQEDLHQFK